MTISPAALPNYRAMTTEELKRRVGSAWNPNQDTRAVLEMSRRDREAAPKWMKDLARLREVMGEDKGSIAALVDVLASIGGAPAEELAAYRTRVARDYDV